MEHYPGFEAYKREAMRAMDGIGEEGEARIVVGHAKDGSGVGAAITALPTLVTCDVTDNYEDLASICFVDSVSEQISFLMFYLRWKMNGQKQGRG